MGKTDPIKRALELRETLVKDSDNGKKLLVVDFTDTLQGKDTSKVIDLMPSSNGNYIIRTKYNIKEIDPIAMGVYNKEFFDVRNKTDAEIENFAKRAEFDFPLWFKYDKGFRFSEICNYNSPEVIQVAGCDFHDGSERGGCWYCFVDDKSNDGVPGSGKTYLGIDDMIESSVKARQKVKKIYSEIGKDMEPKVIRVSGGEPTIALDWIYEMWKQIGKQNIDFVGQIDSNLSTGRVVDRFEKEGIYEDNIMKKLAKYPVKVLTAIKGIDDRNLQKNVQSTATLDDQIYSLKRFLEAGFDIYPQMYNPEPKKLKKYLKMMDDQIDNFSMKIHIGPLKIYSPTEKRLLAEQRYCGKPDLIKVKKELWDKNYKKGVEIIDSYLNETYGIGYKDTSRPDVKLKIL